MGVGRAGWMDGMGLGKWEERWRDGNWVCLFFVCLFMKVCLFFWQMVRGLDGWGEVRDSFVCMHGGNVRFGSEEVNMGWQNVKTHTDKQGE